MEAPELFYVENFENVTWPEPNAPGQLGTNANAWDAGDYVQTLTEYPLGGEPGDPAFQPGYLNANGTTTYTADPAWAAGTLCNGIVVAAHGNYGFSNANLDVPLPQPGPATGCGTGSNFNNLRIMAGSMGSWHLDAAYPYQGSPLGTTASQLDNHVVSSFTNGDAGAGTMLEFDDEIPVDAGRYYQFSIDIASASCIVRNNTGALPQIFVTQGSDPEISAFSTTLNSCLLQGTAGGGAQYGPGGGGNNVARQRTTRVGTFVGDTAIRTTGTTVGLRVDNQRATGNGNDTAFDNILLLDTTPKVDKEFSAYATHDGAYPTGDDATLTFTVTNTHVPGDPATPSGPKEDFAFTDTLAPGLEPTGTSSTTCGDGTVAVDAAAGTVQLTGGDLAGSDLVTCTVTVGVTSATAGTYTNGPDDLELVGLNPPGTTDITFEDAGPVSCPASAQLFQYVPDRPVTSVYDVDLVSGESTDRGTLPRYGANGVGYNAIDGWYYGPVPVGQTGGELQFTATSPDLATQTDLWAPDFSGVGYLSAAGFPAGVNIGDVSPDGVWYGSTAEPTGATWFSMDVDPGSPTFGTVLSGDDSYGTGSTNNQPGDDWSYHDGFLWSVGFNATTRNTLIFRMDPAAGRQSAMSVWAFKGSLAAPDGQNPSGQPGGGSSWGATYLDDAGFLYASNNGTGQIWRFDLTDAAAPAQFFAYGPPSTGNDGARCPGPLPTDFGDAPASYGTVLEDGGPFHGVGDAASPALTLGETVTIESDGQPVASAASDQDDAFADDPVLPVNAGTVSLTVPVVNASGEAAGVAGWIDLDGDGTFDPGERAAADAGTTSGDVTLAWSVPAGTTPKSTYLRLRAVLGSAPPSPTGTSTASAGLDSGEVEDWPLTLAELPLDLGDAPASYGTLLADDGPRHAVVGYDPVTSTAPLMLGDENTVDVEGDGVPGAGADGDDLAGVDDEGSIVEPVELVAGREGTLSVEATNDTAADATLATWVDVDASGTFDADELVTTTVPAGSGPEDHPLTIDASGAAAGTTYGRVRLFAGGTDDPSPTGEWVGGEVEDYAITVLEPSLQVTKTASSSESPLVPGSEVTYTVVAENVGDADFTTDVPATFADDLSGVLDDAAVTAGPTASAGISAIDGDALAWTGALAAGESATVTYTVTVGDPLPGAGDAVLTNAVVGGQCADPAVTDPVDPAFDPDCVTVTPVADLTVVKSSTPSADPLAAGDTVEYTVTVTNTGGASYASPALAVFTDDLTDVLDDATVTTAAEASTGSATLVGGTLSWSGALGVGASATVTYTVTVDDPAPGGPGDGVLTNAVVGGQCPAPPVTDPDDAAFDPDCVTTDPVQAFTVVKSSTADPDPVVPDGTVEYTVTVTNTGGVPYAAPALASFADDLSGVLDDAEVTTGPVASAGTATLTGTTLSWTGELPVGGTVVVTYTVTVGDPLVGGERDGVLTNAVVGGQCPDPAVTDPDDAAFDPGCVTVDPVEDYVVVKVATPSSVPLEPSGTVEYTLSVINSGGVDLAAASVTDDLADVLDDAAIATAPAVSSSNADPGTLAVTASTVSWTGPLAVGDVATITYTVTVGAPVPAGGDAVLTNALVGGQCPDPPVADPDDPAFDPSCVTVTPVAQVLVEKSSDAPAAVSGGETITYSVTITNTGGYDYTVDEPATFTDDLTDVLDDASIVVDSVTVTPSGQGDVDEDLPTLTWVGPLAVGESVTVSYALVVAAPPAAGAELVNTVTGPPESNCAPDAGTADARCSVTVPTLGLEVTKSSSSDGDPLVPGAVVTYTITARSTGTGDYTDEVPATVVDDLTGVLDDAAYGGDVTARVGGDDVGTTDDSALPALSWAGPVAAGETVTITYTVTVGDPLPEAGDGVLANGVSGGQCPDPAVTEPDDPAFDPACATVDPVRALDVVKSKTAPAGDRLEPGQDVTYQIVVTNVGGAAYTAEDPATVADDLTRVLDDAAYGDDATADVGVLTYAEPTLSWTGALVPGAAATITYSVTVADPISGDGFLLNAVTGPPESSCPPGTDDVDCSVLLPGRQLALTKTAAPTGPVAAGDVVTFTVTATNLSEAPYTDEFPALVVDDLAGVLDDAAYDGDATLAPASGTLVYDEPRLVWVGPIPGLGSVTLTYSVTVTDPLAGDGLLENTVFEAVPPPLGCTGDDCDDTPPTPACTGGAVPATGRPCETTATPVRALEILKTSDAGDQVDPGDTVGYSIVVTNTGGYAYTTDDPAMFTDDMTDVLDDATYADDVAATAGSATFAVPTLTWSGPLEPGATVAVTYSVTVAGASDGADGDASLVNRVTGPRESSCAPVEEPVALAATAAFVALAAPPACATQVPVAEPPGTSPPTPPEPTPPDPALPGSTPPSVPPGQSTGAAPPAGTPPGPIPPGSLATTGASLGAVAVLALLLVAVGVALAARRRSRGG